MKQWKTAVLTNQDCVCLGTMLADVSSEDTHKVLRKTACIVGSKLQHTTSIHLNPIEAKTPNVQMSLIASTQFAGA